jgi:Ku protein
MPRASWRGYLRLSLVSCPIYLSPATAGTKPIRLRQVWRGAPGEDGGELEDQVGGQEVSERPASRHAQDYDEGQEERIRPATRITLRPHDPSTGEEVEKEEVVRGYEYQRGQYVTFTPDELKALDLESSKVIDLEMFVHRGELDPVYFNSAYYLYPDGQMALEAIRVIGAAMADAGVVGIGRLTMSRRERMVAVNPRGARMVLITLRAAEEVRAPQFGQADGPIDAEMLAIARAIIDPRTGKFDPSRFRDRYQETLRELIEAKMKGAADPAARDFDPCTSHRSDGGTETQPGAGTADREGRQDQETCQSRTRSPPESVASARVGWPKKERRAGDRTSPDRGETTQEGVIVATLLTRRPQVFSAEELIIDSRSSTLTARAP